MVVTSMKGMSNHLSIPVASDIFCNSNFLSLPCVAIFSYFQPKFSLVFFSFSLYFYKNIRHINKRNRFSLISLRKRVFENIS